MEHLCLHCCKDNVYVDDPSSTQADMDSFTSATNKVATYICTCTGSKVIITRHFVNMYAKTKE